MGEERKKLIKEMDELWSKYIRKKFKNSCARCGSTIGIDAHHIIPRTLLKTRHHPKNGIALCRKCHQFFHNNPNLFKIFVKKFLSNSELEELERLSLSTEKIFEEDLLKRKEELEELLNGLR